MARAFLIVMDSVGIGGAPDAHAFFNGQTPATGANTLGHIAQACADGHAEEGRSGPLQVPTLDQVGLGAALDLASGLHVPGLTAAPTGRGGAAPEISPGKDTPSGHWELAGLPVPWSWHYFPDQPQAFPEDVLKEVCEISGSAHTLGNCHASGTDIIARHGAEHMQTGAPICYTSADSVIQIAAHEGSFGLDRLLDLCERIAPTLHAMKIGRVIARPFEGEAGAFRRTGNRRDYAIAPPAPVLMNALQEAGRYVYAVGKIGDIFSMNGIDEVHKGTDAVLMEHLSDLIDTAKPDSFTFANFVEFDSLYGHRRDVSGYARHLVWFDGALAKLRPTLQSDDLVIITADHGNDPTWVGTDHTRERVPVLVAGQGAGKLGQIGFTDVSKLVATHLNVTFSPA